MRDGAVVVAGGDARIQAVPDGLAERRPVIAADSGLDLAEALGLEVDLVVGDLDSVSAGALERARHRGVPIELSPRDKDLTDLELALLAAAAGGAEDLVVLGGAGGRLDHLLANVAVLCGPLTGSMAVDAWLGDSRVQVLRHHVAVDGTPGSEVSLLAWHGDVRGVTTTGMRWPLRDALLTAGAAVGTSNLLEGEHAEVSVRSGVASVTQRAADAAGARLVDLTTATDVGSEVVR
jgi:thiamine pyrophosphokinase